MDCLNKYIGGHSDRTGYWLVSVLFMLYTAFLPIKSDAEVFSLVDASITDLNRALKKGDITSVQLVEHYLARIEAYDQQNSEINAIIRLNSKALKRAAELDLERKQKGTRGPLHGIPIVVKDNFNTHDIPTSAGSIALAGFTPSSDAFQVTKLRKAGAIILAKSNMDELARGVSGYSSLGGQTKNPYDLTRTPGGSSAGTAAAIAANFAAVGMGTDTCGSIRVPSSFNNLVGLRPTKGLSSIAGIIPLFNSDDVAGPIARSVRDLAIVMDNVADYDPNDPVTVLVQNHSFPGYVRGLGSIDLSTLRLGRLKNYFDNSEISEVNKVIFGALDTLEKQGVTIVDIDTLLFDTAQKEAQPIPSVAFEYKSGMDRYFQSYPGSGFNEVMDFIDHGLYHEFLDRYVPLRTFSRSAPNELQQVRLKKQWGILLNNAIEQVMAKYKLDALIYPTVATLPVKLGALQFESVAHCSLSAKSGAPALALPMGFTKTGLPIGIDLLGARLSDEKLVAIGYAIEKTLLVRRAPLTTPALIRGLAPEPIPLNIRIENVAEVALVFDITKSTLNYQTRYFGNQEIYAICLHTSKQGPIIQCLSGPQGRRLKGSVILNYAHVNALRNGELYLRIFSPASPLGQQHQQLVLPLPE